MVKNVLVAFDFDNTLIAENSDLYVRKLAPQPGVIPEDIKKLYTDHGWTKYMGAIFRYLHDNGTTPKQIRSCMEEIPFVNGMQELLTFMQDSGRFDVIIISDSNLVFIDHILKASQLDATVQKVYSNPAFFNGDGCLSVAYYHTQDWCKISTVNMCKGHILESHIADHSKTETPYDVVAYVGDGTNDLCPSLRLTSKDFLFPRKGYSLMKEIAKAKLSAKVVPWDTGFDIMEVLKAI